MSTHRAMMEKRIEESEERKEGGEGGDEIKDGRVVPGESKRSRSPLTLALIVIGVIVALIFIVGVFTGAIKMLRD